jgi:hypothetical protein
MSLRDYAHLNEDALYTWWQEEGRHVEEPPDLNDPYSAVASAYDDAYSDGLWAAENDEPSDPPEGRYREAYLAGYTDGLTCIDQSEECSGRVELRGAPPDGMRSFARCEFHNDKRWERYESSDLERYANSDVPPPWFDPTAAGERWDDD